MTPKTEILSDSRCYDFPNKQENGCQETWTCARIFFMCIIMYGDMLLWLTKDQFEPPQHNLWLTHCTESSHNFPRNKELVSNYHMQMCLDSFTVPLHSPNGRQLPAVRAVQRDCHWGLKNGGNSHWSCEPIMQWGTRQSQSIFRLTNHKSVMPANWRPCPIQSYCHQVRNV